MTKPIRKGFFITFEGGEGGGKSTQMRLLVKALRRRRLAVVTTLEPGGTPIGKSIRNLVLDPSLKNLSLRSELLLYEADRAHHVNEVILPALRAGKVVVCDRFADSSTVYQGICRGFGVAWTETLNRFATGGLMPDLTLLMDLPTEVGMGRVRQRIRDDEKLKGRRRAVKLDRLEREKTEFHQKVRTGFLKLARRHPRRFKVIDASRPAEEIAAEIEKLVFAKLVGRAGVKRA